MTAPAPAPPAPTTAFTLASKMQEVASLLCDTDGHVRPESFREYVQRAEELELRLVSGTDSKGSKPSNSLASTLPAAWSHWLACVYLNLNAPMMAQAALARLASVTEHPTEDQVARYLWSASNHHRRCHYDVAFDHLRRAEAERVKSESGSGGGGDDDKSSETTTWQSRTSAAVMAYTMDTIAMRQYCSYRAFYCAEQDTPTCLTSSAELLDIPVADLQARLSRWTLTDQALSKECGTVLNAYGKPWSPYDEFGTGTELPVGTMTDAYVRLAIKTASLATLESQ